MSKKQKSPATPRVVQPSPVAKKPAKTVPGAPLSKKAAARAAGDAARAAGVIDNFPRRGKSAPKGTPQPAPQTAAIPAPRLESKPPRPGERPGRPPLVELTIARLDDDGVGIGRHDGKDLLVAGALPGEQVAVSIEAKGQYRLIGRLRRLITRHPRRVKGPCAEIAHCQGCPLSNLDYAAQLDYKQIKVRAAFGNHPALRGLPVADTWGAAAPLGYRTNAKLAFGRKRGKVQIGLFRRGSHEVVDLLACPLHHPLINRIVAVVREEVEKQGIYVYDPVKRRGLLRYLLVRVSPSTGKAMVTFVVAERDFRQLNSLAKWLQRKVPEIVSIQQNVNPSEGNVILGRETLRLLGENDLLDQVGDIRLRLAPASFFQVNHEQAARIYALVRQWAALTREEVAVDLYCGIGGIALHLAQDAGRVYGVETVPEAVQNARVNARLNGLGNCEFLAGDAEEVAEDLAADLDRAAVVVLNPPRGGCDPSVLQLAAGLQPRTMIYVSCNPESLARDLDLLLPLGFTIEEVQPVDMFPQTAHVETVVRLGRTKTDTKRGK